jgi:hypothetical protein
MARMLLLAEAILFSLAVAIAIALVTSLNLDSLTLVGAALAVATAAFVLFALALVRWQLYPDRGRVLASTVGQGMPGLRRRLAALTSDDHPRGR